MKKPSTTRLPSTRKSNKATDKNRRDAFRFKQTLLGNGIADFLTVTEGSGKNKVPHKHRGTLKGLWETLTDLNKRLCHLIVLFPSTSRVAASRPKHAPPLALRGMPRFHQHKQVTEPIFLLRSSVQAYLLQALPHQHHAPSVLAASHAM